MPILVLGKDAYELSALKRFGLDIKAIVSLPRDCGVRNGTARKLTRRGCVFMHRAFVVPPLGGIEPERIGEIPVKTGTTNSACAE